jgi:hypothetical protein
MGRSSRGKAGLFVSGHGDLRTLVVMQKSSAINNYSQPTKIQHSRKRLSFEKCPPAEHVNVTNITILWKTTANNFIGGDECHEI